MATFKCNNVEYDDSGECRIYEGDTGGFLLRGFEAMRELFGNLGNVIEQATPDKGREDGS